ncbi:MAG: cysteine--tRNA ligase [Candidatus Omnitrophica bacterium]|nr:cysteine--tRNA ligase [Candidatus Omnitrophota bacterium]
MSIRLYNTLTRTIEPFEPRRLGEVTMYVCGPTVYDEPHLGHVRSAYVFDVLRRHLARTFRVRFVRNVTDVDDKIIEKARQESAQSAHSRQHTADSELKAKCADVAERYLASYHQALGQLGIQAPDVEPKATEHVVSDGQDFSSMVDLIAKLVATGAAYETKGGDVYFAVRKFPPYGVLSNRTVDELQAGTRVEPGEGKQDPLDFALWKTAKPGEPSWPSPWGQGRPGWHIECSAMSTKYLGDAFDIHGGGLDLFFPHHENEIAQAQAAGKPFAKYWVHHGLVTVNGEKMSKSVGNVTSVEEVVKAGSGEPDVLKMFFLSAHYRSPIDYSPRSLQAALGRYRRVVNFCHRVMNTDAATEPGDLPLAPNALALREEFVNALNDDLNTPKALAALDALVTAGYGEAEQPRRMVIANTIFSLGKTLGLFDRFVGTRLNEEQQQRLRKREDARQRKDFTTADQIRAVFLTERLAIEDTPEGPVVLPTS